MSGYTRAQRTEMTRQMEEIKAYQTGGSKADRLAWAVREAEYYTRHKHMYTGFAHSESAVSAMILLEEVKRLTEQLKAQANVSLAELLEQAR